MANAQAMRWGEQLNPLDSGKIPAPETEDTLNIPRTID